MAKNPPAMQELRVRSLGQEDPLEEEAATHSSILAWEIPGTAEPGGQQSMGSQKSWAQLSNNNKLRHIFFPLKHNCRRKEGRGWGGACERADEVGETAGHQALGSPPPSPPLPAAPINLAAG